MMSIYGYDWGTPDYGRPHNNDHEALSLYAGGRNVESHAESRADSLGPITPPAKDEFYYSQPVPVSFPRELNPLPTFVLENGMNMMYFHYFINYTSRMLVTHDCSSNPFRTVLPQLALYDDNLLSLVLAFAACHRARLLQHAEPINRIASYVTKLFPSFRQTLASGKPITETQFGTCVMLASFTQSYPDAFETPITWPQHLGMARQMCQMMTSRKDRPRSKAMYFFLRWFGYLDTFGACSADAYDGSYREWSKDLLAVEDDPSLKCLTGYTNRALVLLSRAADLAKQCDKERRSTGQLPPALVHQCEQLRCNLELASLETPHQRFDCACPRSGGSSKTFRAVISSLCYAALIILQRRIYLLPSSSHLVRKSVTGIMASLSRHETQKDLDIPDIILPLFLAGCESQDPAQRQEVLRRLQRIGDAGMAQVARVGDLLHHIWETNQHWAYLPYGVLLG